MVTPARSRADTGGVFGGCGQRGTFGNSGGASVLIHPQPVSVNSHAASARLRELVDMAVSVEQLSGEFQSDPELSRFRSQKSEDRSQNI